jgi:putative ABC transport system substrate-binding protein
MRCRAFVAAIIAVTTIPCAAPGQPADTVHRIGLLAPGSASGSTSRIAVFREGLRQLGYIEGQNVAVEYRYADGQADRYVTNATELVRLNVSVIVVAGTTPAIAARNATTSIPIVMMGVSDPVRAGLVSSLSRPGGNITGSVTSLEDGFAGKWVQLLKEGLPHASRIGVIHNPSNPSNVGYWRDIQAAAATYNVRLASHEVRAAHELESAFIAIAADRPAALIVVTDPMLFGQRARILELIARIRVPVMFGFSDFVKLGGLISYGPNLDEDWRRAATFVGKILKGAKPADLPVEQPTKFELVINLKTAKALGLTIPPSLLLRADQVIE